MLCFLPLHKLTPYLPGKGTISKKMLKHFDYHHISTGDLLRAHVREGTDLGKVHSII